MLRGGGGPCTTWEGRVTCPQVSHPCRALQEKGCLADYPPPPPADPGQDLQGSVLIPPGEDTLPQDPVGSSLWSIQGDAHLAGEGGGWGLQPIPSRSFLFSTPQRGSVCITIPSLSPTGGPGKSG